MSNPREELFKRQKTLEPVYGLIDKQSWTEANQAELALTFIYESNLTTQFIEFLEEQAKEENEDT